MTARDRFFRRFRTFLDCLIILLLWIALAEHKTALQARIGFQSSPSDAVIVETKSPTSRHAASLGFAGVDPSRDRAVLDNSTLAAMIAAENAALTSPQYLIHLPMISR